MKIYFEHYDKFYWIVTGSCNSSLIQIHIWNIYLISRIDNKQENEETIIPQSEEKKAIVTYYQQISMIISNLFQHSLVIKINI